MYFVLEFDGDFVLDERFEETGAMELAIVPLDTLSPRVKSAIPIPIIRFCRWSGIGEEIDVLSGYGPEEKHCELCLKLRGTVRGFGWSCATMWCM